MLYPALPEIKLTYPGSMADATGETGEQLLGGLAMRRKASEPTYLQICWEETEPDGRVVLFKAFLCLPHRRERFVSHPSARGSGRLGAECDLCEGREPRRAPAEPPDVLATLIVQRPRATRCP
jgi:hypothetical protein